MQYVQITQKYVTFITSLISMYKFYI